jgi:hypothetical protein
MPEFKKSSLSGEAHGVEVAYDPKRRKVLLRHSKNPDVWQEHDRRSWAAFIKGVKDGEFDIEPETE